MILADLKHVGRNFGFTGLILLIFSLQDPASAS